MAERGPSSNTEIHSNSFEGGLNKDVSKNIVGNNEYFDAQNLTLVESNRFFSLQNIKGTVELESLGIGSDTLVLGVFETKYRVEGTNDVKALTIFTVKPGSPSPTFKIIAYLLEGSDIGPFVLYEALVPNDYIEPDRLVDGVLYPENGLDILYFTDDYYGIRKLRCDIPDLGTPNFVSEFELAVTRGGALGKIELGSVVTGGSLLCGSYQFAYQLVVPGTNKATKFSLLSLPVQIFDNSGTNPVSGVGISTTNKILLNIFTSEDELTSYTHFRLAVIENIYPEGVGNTIAQLTDTQLISNYLSGTYLKDIPYATNLQGSAQTIPIDEIVIDLAAIDHVKTIAVRNNRLLAGNISYEDLTLNNGTPTIGTGSILKSPFDFYTDTVGKYELATKNVGYYRDEVYRFAISYFDENGNFSAPTSLDMSAITGNKILSSIPDNTTGLTLTNPDFTTDLTGWSQVDPGTGGPAWNYYNWTGGLFGPGGGTVRVIGLSGTTYSDILYQPITYVTGKSYVLQIRAAFNRNIFDTLIANSFQVVYLDNSNTILGTQTIPLAATSALIIDPSYIPLTEATLTIPVGTTRLGFRGYSSTVSNTDNQLYIDKITIIGGFKDMRFPARDQLVSTTRFSVLNSDNLPENIGLQLNSITNHPTWSRGFVILRAKRKKNVIWQSPLIPMTSIYGVGAMSLYPSSAFEQVPTVLVAYPDAQPMGPNTTYFPNNYFYAKSRNIVKNIVNVDTYNPLGPPQSAKDTRKEGEAQYGFTRLMTYGLVFPPQTMYTDNSKYSFNEAHDLVSVDATLVDLAGTTYSNATDISTKGGLGNFLDTSVSGTLRSNNNAKFYYDANHSGVKSPTLKTNRVFNVKGYRDFDNLTEGFNLNGADIMKKQNLVTSGVSWDGIDGQNIQRGAVVHIARKEDGITESIINTDSFGGDNLAFSAGSAAPYSSGNQFMEFISGGNQTNANTIEIVNCVANVGEDRYGVPNSFNEYIYTGAHVVFTNSELSTVQSGGSLPKSITVWGGDCIVTKHTFKITDTCYGVANGQKHLTPGGGLTEVALIQQWTRAYSIREVGGSNNDGCMSLPVQFKNCAQFLEIWLESEFNGALVARGQANEGALRTPLSYDNNINHTKQNDQKIFVPVDILFPNVTKTRARIVYSDEKIYQGGVEGFDIFRALNFLDLDETYGSITALRLVGDELYALQEKAIAYIPVGERVLEQTDASTLAVRSGDVLGHPLLVDVKRGCQHMKSIQNTGRTLYFADNFNQAICALGGRELKIVSDGGLQSEFRSKLLSKLDENELTSIYDPVKREYWIAANDGTFCYVFNELIGKWVSNYEFPNGVKDGYYTNQKLYIVGFNETDNNLYLYEMYQNPESFLFDTYVVPRVQFTINPEFQFGKNFDDLLVVSSDRLNNVDLEVEREASLGNQVSNGLSLDVTSRGLGNYRVKVLRDAVDARLKGSYMKALLRWKSGASTIPVTLTTVLTQYRPIKKLF